MPQRKTCQITGQETIPARQWVAIAPGSTLTKLALRQNR